MLSRHASVVPAAGPSLQGANGAERGTLGSDRRERETGDRRVASAPSITWNTFAPAAFSTRPGEAPPNNLAGTKRSLGGARRGAVGLRRVRATRVRWIPWLRQHGPNGLRWGAHRCPIRQATTFTKPWCPCLMAISAIPHTMLRVSPDLLSLAPRHGRRRGPT